MFAAMAHERDKILDSAISLVYFMRGAIQYETMFKLAFVERRAIEVFLENRLEHERKKMYPVY